jgi:hypothetical protein
MNPILATPDFLQKVVGLAAATNAVMEKSAADRAELRKAAEVAVNALEKAGKLGQFKKAEVIDGIVAKPAVALELLQKLAEDTKVEGKKEEGKEKKEEPAPMGAAAESEKEKKSAHGAGVRESDEIWDKGFGIK